MQPTSSNIEIEPTLRSLEKNLALHHDIYFTQSYAKLYEEKEQGTAHTVYFECDAGEIEYTFIKRPVPFLVEGKQYYDLTTAYGYGGPHIVETSDPEMLLNQFQDSFRAYCLKNDIISEFIRFHLFDNEDVKLYFQGEMQFIGHHIARDLTKPMEVDFHKSVGRSVRKALRKEVTVSFDRTGDSLQQFLDIYHQTMVRNEANDFYYFEDDFFEKLHQALDGNFLYVHAAVDGKIISSFLVIISDLYAYGFLGGTLEEYFSYDSATLLEYQIIERLKEEGLRYYVLGGGYRGDDGLYKFKKKFDLGGDHSYFIGKVIHNEDVYQQLVDLRFKDSETLPNSKFFPLYRL